ncbi:hypothetical protein BDZ97DRAFT_1277599 [Flammula alnicola]|nr:hypothetical protein BDZ97DRAFT_1277599 [Flammula alnicola]
MLRSATSFFSSLLFQLCSSRTMPRSIDTWDDEPRRPTRSIASASGSKSSIPKIQQPIAVRDDWELDDDEEEDVGRSVDEQNKRIWEDANTKEHHPMPALVISRGTSASVTTPSLPLNQPPAMRILKRPSASPSQSSTNVNATTGETLQEREARYQAARERIFGSSSEETPENGDKKSNPTFKKATTSTLPPPSPATKAVRDPRGPSNGAANASGKSEDKGFGERKKLAPPSSTTPVSTASTTPTSTSNIPI